jgi:NADH-quinone oxidoreductase subunit D
MVERRFPPAGRGIRTDTVPTVGGVNGHQIATAATGARHERIVANMGPQHPTAELRLILQIDGRTVTKASCGIRFQHAGVEKSLQYRLCTQNVTCVTRTDNLSPFFSSAAYCLGVEALLNVTEAIPERAKVVRVLLMELDRIYSHLAALTTGGMELGVLTAMRCGRSEGKLIQSVFDTITGLRLNHAYIRPGGLARDLPDAAIRKIRDLAKLLPKRLRSMQDLLDEDVVWKARTRGIGFLDQTRCIAVGVTGPVLRSAGVPHDLRRAQPYCGYETYEFEVITETAGDAYARYLIRVKEMQESLKIVEQCLDHLAPGPIRAIDPKLARFTDLALGPDDFGDSRRHLATIMGASTAALAHHFELVTEDIRGPAGQVYVAVESPCGELGVHIVSDGGTRPYRVHYRDPSFANLQAIAAMCEGATIAESVAAIASIDPAMKVHR